MLVSVIATYMLGVYMKVRVTPVKSVIGYSHTVVLLNGTSRVFTWARNRTPALFVAKTSQRKLTSSFTFELYTMARSPTSVLCAVEGLVREVPLPVTSGMYT